MQKMGYGGEGAGVPFQKSEILAVKLCWSIQFPSIWRKSGERSSHRLERKFSTNIANFVPHDSDIDMAHRTRLVPLYASGALRLHLARPVLLKLKSTSTERSFER